MRSFGTQALELMDELKMKVEVCKRCGMENEVNQDVLELHKCPQCENIKFDREFFVPIETQVVENFKKAQASRFGAMLKGLYVFGSYATGASKCGDIDFLVTYSRPKLRKFIQLEIESFHEEFWLFDPEDYSLSELKSILEESFWDFRTCDDYPDCLSCYEEDPTCRLPSEDYNSDFHTYCLERCRSKNKEPIPLCCFGYCTYLEILMMRRRILDEMGRILKEGDVEFCEVRPNLKIKVLDLVVKRKTTELEEEFKNRKEGKDFQLFRINLVNGKKTRVRRKKRA